MSAQTPNIRRRRLLQGAGASAASSLLGKNSLKAAPGVTFTARQLEGIKAPYMICDTALVDLTRNGRSDFVGANHIQSGIGVSLNSSKFQPDKPFGQLMGYPFEDNAVGHMSHESSAGVAYADFNGDGLIDVASSNHPGSVGVFINTGAPPGQPLFKQGYVAELTEIRQGQPGIKKVGVAGVEGGLAAGDFNGNGRPDIVTANLGNNTIAVLMNTTPKGQKLPTFAAPVYFRTATPTASVAVADLNNNRKADIIAVDTGGTSISVFINETEVGSPTPKFAAPVQYKVGRGPVTCAAVDFDGDGHLDVVTADWTDQSLSVLLGKGDGTFHPAVTIPIGQHPVVVRAADFNGDGKPDIVAIPLNPKSRVIAVFLMNTSVPGKVSFADPQIVYLPKMESGWLQYNYFSTSGAVGDVTGNGRPDVVVAVTYHGGALFVTVPDNFLEFTEGRVLGVDWGDALVPDVSYLVLITANTAG